MDFQGVRFWLLGLFFILIVNCFGLFEVTKPVDMFNDLENHDLRFLLTSVRDRDAPLSWFVSDWPLYNGFYRPLPTLSFELDNALFYNHLSLYRWQNFLIALGCAFLTVWFVWELFRSCLGAIACGLVFSLWQSGITNLLPLETVGLIVGGLLFLYGLWPRHGGLVKWFVVGCLVYMVFRELSLESQRLDIVQATFSFRSIGWPVGRTATLFAFFGLVTIASYCRFERSGSLFWGILSLVALLGCFGSYEQCVVMPAVLLACAIALRIQGVRVHWLYHILPIGMTTIYVVLHSIYLPPDTRYRSQALRGLQGGLRQLTEWVFPASIEIRVNRVMIDPAIGIWVVVLQDFWINLIRIVANVTAYVEARSQWLPILFGLLVSAGALAPLAFQHPLVHYLYYPLSIRSMVAVWLAYAAWLCYRGQLGSRKILASNGSDST